MDWIVTQGLGADHLVTQGWSSGTLSPSLISQGLGGPQILLQGLVGAGGAMLISPSGGLRLGGQAGTKLWAKATPGGGLTSSGAGKAAASVHVLACGHTGQGGSVLATATFALFAGGGMSLGGGQNGEDLGYHVYANTGSGEPINYSVCLATVTGQSWTSPALSCSVPFQAGGSGF